MPRERDDLLDPARAVGVTDRRGQQPRNELDALRVRIGRPRARVVGALSRGQLVARGVHRRPQRGTAGGEIAVAAEPRLEGALLSPPPHTAAARVAVVYSF